MDIIICEHFSINGHCSKFHFTRNESYNNCCYLCIHNIWIINMYHTLLLLIFTSISATYSLRKYKDDLKEEIFKKVLEFKKKIGVIISIGYLGLFLSLEILVLLFYMFVMPIKCKIIRYKFDLDDKEA